MRDQPTTRVTSGGVALEATAVGILGAIIPSRYDQYTGHRQRGEEPTGWPWVLSLDLASRNTTGKSRAEVTTPRCLTPRDWSGQAAGVRIVVADRAFLHSTSSRSVSPTRSPLMGRTHHKIYRHNAADESTAQERHFHVFQSMINTLLLGQLIASLLAYVFTALQTSNKLLGVS